MQQMTIVPVYARNRNKLDKVDSHLTKWMYSTATLNILESILYIVNSNGSSAVQKKQCVMWAQNINNREIESNI